MPGMPLIHTKCHLFPYIGARLDNQISILPVEDVIPDAGDAEKHGTGKTSQNQNHPYQARRMRLLPRDHIIRKQ